MPYTNLFLQEKVLFLAMQKFLPRPQSTLSQFSLIAQSNSAT